MKLFIVLLVTFLLTIPSFAQDIEVSMDNQAEAYFPDGCIKRIGNILIIQNGNEIKAVSVGKKSRALSSSRLDADDGKRTSYEEVEKGNDDLHIAEKYMKEGDYYAAASYFKFAGKPDEAIAVYLLAGEEEMEQERYNDAAISFRDAFRPDKAKQARLLQGQKYIDDGRYYDAGVTYKELGLEEEARAMFLLVTKTPINKDNCYEKLHACNELGMVEEWKEMVIRCRKMQEE